MEIQQLRYVLAAAEHRSFTNAATAVHVTQSMSHLASFLKQVNAAASWRKAAKCSP